MVFVMAVILDDAAHQAPSRRGESPKVPEEEVAWGADDPKGGPHAHTDR